MITIISNDKLNSEFIKSLLEFQDLEIKISTSEIDIVKADKIILPDSLNFSAAYRKLQFCNLFSVLRLINKPVLGINVGSHLMCNRIISKDKIGLGLLDFDTNLNDYNSDDKKYHTGFLKLIGKSQLINNNCDGLEIEISKQNLQPINNFTKSIIRFDDGECSLTFEKGNYFGVNLNFEKNPLLGKNIIENFILI